MDGKKILLAAVFAISLFAFPVHAQEGEETVRQFSFTFYYSIGRSQAACYSNCMAACQSACYGAAGGGKVTCFCAGSCGACAGAFSGCEGQIICQRPVSPEYSPSEIGTTETEDGLPLFPSAEGGVPIGGQGITPGDTEEQIEQKAKQEQQQYQQQWAQYCGGANQCQACANRDRCIWTGVACVPCTATTCRFFCPNGRRVETQQPPTVEQAKEQASQPPQTTPQPTSRPGTTPSPAFEPTPTPTKPTPTPTLTPTAPNCRAFKACEACTSATPAQEGNCAWSEFTGLCISLGEMSQLDQYDIKTGWATTRDACKREEQKQKEDCSDYNNCFTCAGVGGVKRECQWSERDQVCVNYQEGSDFKTAAQKDGNYVVFPAMCQKHDCAAYTECEKCAKNSRCAWSSEEDKCIQYQGILSGIMNPRWCPKEEEQTSLPKLCPYGCKCDGQNGLVECTDKKIDVANAVSPKRAAMTAWTESKMETLTHVSLFDLEGEDIYIVTGKRTGVFLGLLPIEMEYRTRIDAKTGKIHSTDKPWWEILTT